MIDSALYFWVTLNIIYLYPYIPAIFVAVFVRGT